MYHPDITALNVLVALVRWRLTAGGRHSAREPSAVPRMDPAEHEAEEGSPAVAIIARLALIPFTQSVVAARAVLPPLQGSGPVHLPPPKALPWALAFRG